MIEVIYCCGDSHTAGGELADDIIWPNEHPGFVRESEIALRDPRRLSKWREFRDRSLRSSRPVTWQQWSEQEAERSWPSCLSRLTGITVINGACIGSSMEWIARQTLTDVGHLLRGHAAESIMVMVQPPTMVRIQLHDTKSGGWNSMQMADGFGVDPIVHNWFATNETDESLATRWIMGVVSVAATLRSQGIRVVLVKNGFTDYGRDIRAITKGRSLIDLYDRVCGALWHDRSMADAAIGIDYCYCPDLHWTREVHQRFAEDLATVI